MKDKKEKWIKEFDEKWITEQPSGFMVFPFQVSGKSSQTKSWVNVNSVKSFVSRLLKAQKQELKKKVEGRMDERKDAYWDRALVEVINLLKNKEKE